MTTTTMTGGTEVSFDDDIPSSYVLDRAMREALREPFPPNLIGKVNKGFGQVDFVGHAAITDRLNQAAPGWTYRVEPVVIQGKDGLPHVMAVFGTMTVGGVTRQEVGDVEHMSRYGDELKKAISDFIVRGAMRFGVGLDLWSKEDLQESAPPRGRHGADGGAGSITQSSDSPTSSEGTTAADAASSGTRGTTADPSDPSAPAAGPGGVVTPSGAATKGGGKRSRRSAPSQDPVTEPPPPAGAKKYPMDPRNCLHMVGVDADDRCEDCGTKMTVSA